MKNKELNFTFHSGLSKQIALFIAEKHQLGYKYLRESYELQNLDRFGIAYDCKDNLTQEIVLAWTQREANQKTNTVIHKMGVIRELAKFMQRNGASAYLLPKIYYPKVTHEFSPYIFTKDEMSRFFQVMDNIKPAPESPLRYLILPIFFRLLYCCGLRVSEALNLKVKDIDLTNGIVYIFHAKAYRDRLIPLTKNLRQRCMDYANRVLEKSSPDDYFFPSTDKGIYHVFTMRTAFKDCLWKCNIPYLGRDKGPRLHDLRHTFSVHCLQNFIVEGKNPNEVLPILAAYLGHKTYKGTSKYLHLTAEIYPDIVSATEKRYGSLIPESEGKNE